MVAGGHDKTGIGINPSFVALTCLAVTDHTIYLTTDTIHGGELKHEESPRSQAATVLCNLPTSDVISDSANHMQVPPLTLTWVKCPWRM